MLTLALANLSTLYSDDDVADLAVALNMQLTQHLLPAWSVQAVVVINKTPTNNQIPVWLVNQVKDAPPGALAWHSQDTYNRPDAIIPIKLILDSGDKVSSSVDHEVLETVLDRFCNLGSFTRYKNSNGKLVNVWMFQEIADPVENDEYNIPLPNGKSVVMSNFVFPEWYISNPPSGTTKFDHMNILKAPLTLSKGGYVSYYVNGKWQQDFAEHIPKHQKIITPYSRRWKRQQYRIYG